MHFKSRSDPHVLAIYELDALKESITVPETSSTGFGHHSILNTGRRGAL